MTGHDVEALVLAGTALSLLSVVVDLARGSPSSGGIRTLGRTSNAVFGVLTRPFRRRWWRDVHVEVDLPPPTRAAPDDPRPTRTESALLRELRRSARGAGDANRRLLAELSPAPTTRARARSRRERIGAQPDARWSSSVPYCTHRYPASVSNLCMRYGCPDDPSWIGDRR